MTSMPPIYSTAVSLRAFVAFAVLGNIRTQCLEKLSRMSLGDVQAKGSGELKNVLVERVDSIEPTLAHAIPEMSSNAAAAILTLIYLFCPAKVNTQPKVLFRFFCFIPFTSRPKLP